ncbi:MAG: cytochrome c [Acidobacteriota bacterium]|nr:cytochrome c [Acidobacteriota bacterium]
MRRLVSIAVGVGFLLFVSVPAAQATDATADLYKSKCQMCHGPNGKGDTAAGKKLGARDFHAPEIMKLTDAELTGIINKGKNKMPAYAGKLTPEQIKGLIAYVRELCKH